MRITITHKLTTVLVHASGRIVGLTTVAVGGRADEGGITLQHIGTIIAHTGAACVERMTEIIAITGSAHPVVNETLLAVVFAQSQRRPEGAINLPALAVVADIYCFIVHAETRER